MSMDTEVPQPDPLEAPGASSPPPGSKWMAQGRLAVVVATLTGYGQRDSDGRVRGAGSDQSAPGAPSGS